VVAATPAEAPVVEASALPADLFKGVIGLEQEREDFRACLEASPPVSVLLSGPPASAKTVLVAEVARLGGATTIHGGAITSAGLTQLLLDASPPRWLIIDEADKGRPVVLNRLLSVIETGLITDLRYGGHREAHVVVTVIMVVNDPLRLDPALRSRLWPIALAPYADEETRRTVIAGFLAQREGVDPELAQEIATLVAPHTSDVRRARDVARLCQGDRRRAAVFASRLAR
jgi:Holliday junction DNA helicase RuvB